jgi:hypothetical protein
MRPLSVVTFLAVFCAAPLAADEADKKYDELFSFPPKAKLEAEQKDKLAELRKKHEKTLQQYDRSLRIARGEGAVNMTQLRVRLLRIIEREKRAILTEDQKKTLGIKVVTPAIAQEKALKDPKVWETGQLEKHFTIQSRSYDPETEVISIMVIGKRALTKEEAQADGQNWQTEKVRVEFFNKEETLCGRVDPHYWYRGLSRTPAKLTEKEEKDGLVRYLIKIDLGLAVGGKNGATARFVCTPSQSDRAADHFLAADHPGRIPVMTRSLPSRNEGDAYRDRLTYCPAMLT